MKATKVFTLAVISGVLAASLVATPAFAWHPKGVIKKSVQNQTSNSQLVDADTAATAITAHPGDILRYVIEIKNTGDVAGNGSNDMYFTKLTDILPSGVSLVSDPSQRTITEDFGTIQPGKSVSKEYLVKVTSTANNDAITNTACFTGNSQVKDAPQSGCNPAIVLVSVPQTPTPPTPTPPAELPHTGISSITVAGLASLSGLLGYAVSLVASKRRNS